MGKEAVDNLASHHRASDQADWTGLLLGLLALAAILPIFIFVVLVPGFWTDALWLLLLGSPVLAGLALRRALTRWRATRTRPSVLAFLSGLISFLLLAGVVITYVRLQLSP